MHYEKGKSTTIWSENYPRSKSWEVSLRPKKKFAFALDCRNSLRSVERGRHRDNVSAAWRDESIKLLIFSRTCCKKLSIDRKFPQKWFRLHVALALFFLRNMRWSRFLTEDDKKRTKNNTIFFCVFFSPSTALYQKRYNRDRKYRFKLQKQIEEEYEKHQRLEEILKSSGTTDSLKSFAGKRNLCDR